VRNRWAQLRHACPKEDGRRKHRGFAMKHLCALFRRGRIAAAARASCIPNWCRWHTTSGPSEAGQRHLLAARHHRPNRGRFTDRTGMAREGRFAVRPTAPHSLAAGDIDRSPATFEVPQTPGRTPLEGQAAGSLARPSRPRLRFFRSRTRSRSVHYEPRARIAGLRIPEVFPL